MNKSTTIVSENESRYKEERWGLPLEAVEDLVLRLGKIWLDYRALFKTKTRDTSEYGYAYLRGLLTMEHKRNYVNISRMVIDPKDDGQNIQNFMSDSPWSSEAVFERIRSEIMRENGYSGGMLCLDESGDERSGGMSAGAARQYIGRHGKTEMGQVGVVLSYTQNNVWTMVDGELFFPQCWFKREYKQLRKKLHIPENRSFKTKSEIGLEMIAKAKQEGLDFSIIGCDSYYGTDNAFRSHLDRNGYCYIAGTRSNVKVYTEEPRISWRKPLKKRKNGSAFIREIFSDTPSQKVSHIAQQLEFQQITTRNAERGELTHMCAACTVFTVDPQSLVRKEWLFVRKEHDGKFSYAFSNAPCSVSIEQLALWRTTKYFVERTIQDAKSQVGWDELVARKYRAWTHHLALVALALWFAAQTKLQ